VDILELAQILDSTTAVLVLVAVLWRLLSQVDRVINATDALLNRLIDVIETDTDADAPTPPPRD
jgi:hypothetical protein